jgi:glutathione S-transferase
MAPIKPVLVVFGISHFCEKARWALDWHGISYTEIGWPPGLHRALLKRHGAKGSSLPVVLEGDLVVEGSGPIIDWAENKAQDRTRSLNPQTADLAEVREIERRAGEVIGIHVRRLAYAETLPYYPRLIKPTLFLGCSPWHRFIGSLMWPLTRRIMMRAYDIRPGAASESRAVLESELDWLDAKLSDGRFYLAGNRFSRADLTVASLLAGFARPKERPVYHGRRPDALAADIERWRSRPAMKWVIEQYRRHRTRPRKQGDAQHRPEYS